MSGVLYKDLPGPCNFYVLFEESALFSSEEETPDSSGFSSLVRLQLCHLLQT